DTSACEHHRPPLFCIPPWEGRESQNVPWTVLPRHSSVNSTVATVDGSLQGYPRRIPHGGERHHPSDSNRLVAGVIRIASPAPPAGGSASHHVEPFYQRGEGHRGIDITFRHMHAETVRDQHHSDHQQE